MIPRSATLSLALNAALTIAAPAFAQCTGADLTETLTDADRARIEAEVAATPYGVGRAFTAERGEEEIFLFGTFHSEVEGGIPAPVEAALDGAETLLVEITAGDQAALEAQMQSDPGLFMAQPGNSVRKGLSGEEWAQIEGHMTQVGMPVQAVEMMQPWFVTLMMSFPVCEIRAQAQGATAIDSVIDARAAGMGVTVEGLETPMEALSALSDMSRDEQMDILRLTLGMNDDAEAMFTTMMDLYEEGRIAEILSLSMIVSEREQVAEVDIDMAEEIYLDRLLTDRNAAWMPAILDAAARGPAVVAVGALHLGGEDGLLTLLEGEGFAIERVVLDGEVAQ
ncbi:TraB/GumN family protein [Roseobacter sp. HKCCA0434]|uniref:TraB/GumN family protein n=1 Tax=Roseobacter sp. HKCCA0434 TaxID=3079297 RepID=UPI0029058E25|nr:TraB/GumN family protein [Roseobacter sp. HKCCA0434]